MDFCCGKVGGTVYIKNQFLVVFIMQNLIPTFPLRPRNCSYENKSQERSE
jgi:hypothetical protein